MTFTLLSPIFLILITMGIISGAIKGRKNGFFRSAVNFGAVLFALLFGSLLSSYIISPKISAFAMTILADYVDLSAILSIGDSFEQIIEAIFSMVLSSVIFLVVFTALYFIFNVVTAILFKTVLKPHASDLGYASDRAPWHVRNSKGLGMTLGIVSSLILAMAMLSPIVGTLKTADNVISFVNEVKSELDKGDEEADLSDDVATVMNVAATDEYFIEDSLDTELEQETEDPLELVTHYSSDFMSTILYYGGAKVVYDMGARARVNGKTVVLTKEIDLIEDIVLKAVKHGPAMADLANFTSEDMNNLLDICDGIGKSHLLSIASAEFVSGIAEGWLYGEDFMGVARPSLDSTVDPLLDVVLQVIAATNEDTVSADLKTIVRVCSVIAESDIVSANGDYNSLMSSFEDGTLIDRITMVLESNPRMAKVADNLYLLVMKTVVNTIKFDGYDLEQYGDLITDLTEQFNRLNGQKHEKKVETLTGYAMEYIGDYGLDVPEEVAKMVVSAMISSIPTTDGYITSDQMAEFFDSYSSAD